MRPEPEQNGDKMRKDEGRRQSPEECGEDIILRARAELVGEYCFLCLFHCFPPLPYPLFLRGTAAGGPGHHRGSLARRAHRRPRSPDAAHPGDEYVTEDQSHMSHIECKHILMSHSLAYNVYTESYTHWWLTERSV